MGRFFSWKREFGLNKFRGSVFFSCYKEPENQVTILDCQSCPFGDYYKDWQGTGWPVCWYKWQQDIQHLKELELKEEQEKMDFEQMLRENQAENEELREKWRREEEEQEPRLRRLREQVEREVKEGMKLSLWPAKQDQIDWNRVHGIEQDEDEEEPSEEDDGD
jgi:hypothetical protein